VLGGIGYQLFSVSSGTVITYSIGIGGAGGYSTNNGSGGTSTSATINGITIYGYGGNGGLYNNTSSNNGGSYSATYGYNGGYGTGCSK
jgi:hypothetical protein